MSNPGDYRRCFCAILLICVMISQWFMGSLYLNKTIVIEVRKEMNSIEKRLSANIYDQYGFQPHIAIVDDDGIAFFQSLGYAAPFVHALEIDGNTHAFTLDEQRIRYYELELDLKPQRPDPDEQQRRASVERLFVQFCIEEPAILELNPMLRPEANFILTEMRDLFDHSIPSPPPRIA